LQFARFFGTSPEVWLNLQSQYEIDVAKTTLWDKIVATVKPALNKTACL
jgi:plasmid maintenance system antidote protein VapI